MSTKDAMEVDDKVNVNVKIEITYFLLVNDKIKKISNLKDIKKIFVDKADLISAFVNDNNLIFSNEEDLKKLIKFCTE